MKFPNHRFSTIVATCALALSAAACGSSSSSGGGSPGEIVIGNIGAYSGAFASTSGFVPQVIDAWAESVNAAGGLNGHKVRVITKDVGMTTGAGVTAVQELINKEHVTAILDFDPSDTTWVRLAAAKSVPVIAAFSSLGSLLSPNVFSIVTSPIALAYGAAAEARKLGDKIGIAYAAESAEGGQIVAMMQTFGDGLGLTLATAVKLSSSAADYTVFCQQLRDSGANSYFLGFATATAQKITDQCFQQGVRIPQLLSGPVAVPAWKTDAAYDGSPVIDGVAPFFDTSVPGQKAYRDALGKYAPSLVESSSTGTFVWAAAQLIATVVPTISTEITPESLQNALYSVKDETLGGLVPPVTFTKGQTSTVNCYFVWKVSGGNYTAPNGTSSTCAPAAAIAPVESAAVKAAGG
ncbi:ABC transporter substrate-binding protein [Nocardia vinacea]|uniref:ABC transporter substrate-binding protein n=1 Tax=Nocardia vinacea TaxID=96468 RepID=UPI00030F34D8|nr:ABC transporter substrate-binding protein [Nocardia vinacea]